jgi:hypothetical protein
MTPIIVDTNKAEFILTPNMGLLKKVSAIFGFALIIIAIANVEFGALMSLDPPQKLILANLANDGCNELDIQRDLNSGSMNDCVTTMGVWDAADVLMLVEGCAMFLAIFLRWPRKGRWAARVRRLSIIAGGLLCTLALADRFDLIPGGSAQLAELLPFPAPAIAVQLAFFSIGIFLLRGPKYVIDDPNAEKKSAGELRRLHSELDRVYAAGGALGSLSSKKGKISKGVAKYTTVKDLWIHQGLSEYEDEFEAGLRDDSGGPVARTCHLCSGQGCASCNFSGAAA